MKNQLATWEARGQYGKTDVALTSFTKTAANVLRGAVDVPDHLATTLHAYGLQALGRPKIAETDKEVVSTWNTQIAASDEWRIAPRGGSADEEGLSVSEDGRQFEMWKLVRSAMLPEHHPLRLACADFAEKWEAFKTELDVIDFTDMITLTLQNELPFPYDVGALVVDEAQDLQPAQWALVRQWAQSLETFLVAGDPGQCLFSYTGARPDELLEKRDGIKQQVLSQSYRLPVEVFLEAESWLGAHHSGSIMEGREYSPRDEMGSVERIGSNWRTPAFAIDAAAAAAAAGKTVMVLAQAHYQLGPTVAEMRNRGMAFSNVYRPTDGQWNPLGQGKTAARVEAFAHGSTEGWPEMIRATAFTSTKKTALEDPARIEEWLTPEAHAAFKARDIAWLQRHLTKQFERPAEYAARLVRAGVDLRETPRITVGTVHSVKGAEAQVVIFFPELSRAAWQEWSDNQDAGCRMAYVAMTRASERLIYTDVSPGGYGLPL
ncbi:MAG TPA: UvrD-helicase domain-containing protein, partial [Thermoleophilia bacterium]|nr:UvrD-helicase domain-containing protein [Thermoleophilia bacterium]